MMAPVCVRVLLLVSVSWTATTAFLLDDNTFINLLNLISQEKKLRATLETEIQNLRSDITNAQALHQSAVCTCPASKVVAFSATLTKDITNLGTAQPIPFDHVITNVGGAYDARHGAFRAPVSGTYKFAFSVLQGTSTMFIGLELVRDNTVIGRIKTGDSSYYNVGTNIINVHLNAGQDVWVRHMSDSDTKRVVSGGGYFTMFTGHLVRAD